MYLQNKYTRWYYNIIKFEHVGKTPFELGFDIV